MIRKELLNILICPETRSTLTLAEEGLVSRVNRSIAQGTLRNRAGQAPKKEFEGGLVRTDRQVMYPIVDGIPMMLVDEAILLDQPALAD